jgi:hypothetical protein
MKTVAIAIALGLLGSSAAMAQSVTIDTGGHRGWDRGRHEGFRMHRDRDVSVRRVETGSVGCRTTTIRKRNFNGDMVVKRIRRCD